MLWKWSPHRYTFFIFSRYLKLLPAIVSVYISPSIVMNLILHSMYYWQGRAYVHRKGRRCMYYSLARYILVGKKSESGWLSFRVLVYPIINVVLFVILTQLQIFWSTDWAKINAWLVSDLKCVKVSQID